MGLKRFSIRPVPKSGESLSGFLVRVAHKNLINYRQLFKLISTGNPVYARDKAHHLDILPERIIDLSLLSELVNAMTQTLYTMTFHPVYTKFLDEVDSTEKYRSVMQVSTDKRIRRFCTECLREEGVYKLIWQIKEIVICDRHGVRLSTTCPTCLSDQPFISDSMATCTCHFCGTSMKTRLGQIVELEQDKLEYQRRKYSEWRQLLSFEEGNLVQPITSYSNEKSLPITMLYVSQNSPKEVQLERELSNGLVRMISDRDNPRWISIEKFLSFIRAAGISLTTIKNVNVPDSFVKSIQLSDTTVGCCLASWCKYYGTGNGLRRITWKNGFKGNGAFYYPPYICTGCYMKYGIKDGNWENVVGRACDDISSIENVRNLLNQGMTQRRIREVLGFDPFVVSRIMGYLAYYKMLNKKLMAAYSVDEEPENIVDCIKQIGNHPLEGVTRARSLFGWDRKTFYYYMASPKVQDYLFSEQAKRISAHKDDNQMSPLLRDRLSRLLLTCKASTNRITFADLAMSLAINVQLLSTSPFKEMILQAQAEQRSCAIKQERKELRTKIRDFVRDKQMRSEPFTVMDVCLHMGRTHKYMSRNHSRVTRWIALLAKQDAARRIAERKQFMMAEVRMAIEQLAVTEEHVTVQKIADFTGISYKQLYTYSEVVKAINDAKLRFRTGRVFARNK